MAAGGPVSSKFYVERQLLTRLPATPTNPGAGGVPKRTSNESGGQVDPGQGNPTPGDGLSIANLMAITVSVYPWTGATLSGAGTLLCWIFNTYQNIWTRCPDLDQTFGTSGIQAQTFASMKMPSRLGMLLNFTTSAVTVSAGTDVLVRIDGFDSVLGMAS
jgi:hypothetical protein